jgi:alpha-tubulin suppressor-like RCC1 family protein/HPt (histidine-containing phosphotransfer) domain-containing protein
MSTSFKSLSKTLKEHTAGLFTLRKQNARAVTTKKTSVNLFQAITAMKKGLQVWKLPHRHYLVGKAHMCCLRLSTDEKSLYWYSQKNRAEVAIYLEQIVDVGTALPEEMKSWTGYCESLAFTVYFQTAAASSGNGGDVLATPTTASASASGGGAATGGALGNVTFVCKNAMEHRIWTVTLEILLKFSDMQKGEDRLNSVTPPPGLPSKVMSKEISQVVRNIQTVIIDEKLVESQQQALSTPQGAAVVVGGGSKDLSLLSSSRQQDQVSVQSVYFTSASLPPETSPYCYGDPSASTPVTGSVVSYPAEDRVIGDSWVWGRGMDKVGKHISDQVYPTLLHGQKTLDAYQIACGEHHIVIIDEIGSVYTWGFSGEGQLGHGAPVESFGPMQVKAFEGSAICAVSCGTTTTIVVTEKGEAFFWGHPMYSFAEPTWYPKRLDTGSMKVKQVSCGAYHFAMCTREGRLLTCGGGKFGALGHGDFENCEKPRLVQALETSHTEHVSCGIWHTAAIILNQSAARNGLGEVYTWGDNSVGQLGYKDPPMTSWPLYVEGLSQANVASVVCGRHHTLALTREGQLYSWGSNKSGQLGRTLGEKKRNHEPGVIVELNEHMVTKIAAGMDHNLVIATSKKTGQGGTRSFLFSWGGGDFGCLGHGNSSSVNLPKQIQSLSGKKAVNIACGANTSCAIIEHHFMKEMERTDVCQHCLAKVKRKKKKSCSRCGVVFCKNCIKQYPVLKPLLPLMTSEQNVQSNKCPAVCMECSDIILEAQLEAKHQFTHQHPQSSEKRTGGAAARGRERIISLDKKPPPAATAADVKELEQRLHEAQQEIRQLKRKLQEQSRSKSSSTRDSSANMNKNLVTRSKSLADLQL